MSTQNASNAAAFVPEAGIGLPIAVGTFGFSVLMLGIPNAGLVNGDAAKLFIAVAFGTGAFGLFIGGHDGIPRQQYLRRHLRLVLLGVPADHRHHAQGVRRRDGPRDLRRRLRYLASPVVRVHLHAVLGSVVHQHTGLPGLRAAGDRLSVARAGQLQRPRRAAVLSTLGGWVLIADGLVAWYLSWALAVNPVIGNKLPLWRFKDT